ncbi:MAG: Ycf48-like protein precursor [Mucilaginibacter sp.]|nr:Ycf48-like protein precursor [Mucilaginibacter sp.]
MLQQGKPTSIRGLSVVDDKVAWISGSKGHIAITTDGGKTWDWQQVKGFEKADFRDIEAFSAKEAIIMSSGTPALILKTVDGGANWNVKYRNADTAYFFDAMAFTDNDHGYVLGDPINNKFLLLETKDGGEIWNEYDHRPAALSGEAAFAASGTCLALNLDKKNLAIVTGGSHARILFQNNDHTKWDSKILPLQQGGTSQGAFSMVCGYSNIIVVGGNYSHDKFNDSTACYLTASKPEFTLTANNQVSFQSCVEYIKDNTFISTGTSGSNLTTDGGKTWTKIDDASYNVCRKAGTGKLVLLAGNGGKIGILKL